MIPWLRVAAFLFVTGSVRGGIEPPNPCRPNPCENGGTCSSDGPFFTCSCPPGYTGQLCDMETGFGTTLPPSQDERLFFNVCENCTVAGGLGFSPHNSNCNCYYTCVLFAADKLASYANPWVSYLRCCPCHMTFSSKLLTCVDYTDKRSDCFNPNKLNDPCTTAGVNLPHIDQDDVDGAPLCSGFLRCVEVGGVVVPNPDCCTEGSCFDAATGMCTSAACSSCAKRDVDDCECDSTPEPTAECGFVSMSSSIFQFMGRENMKTYDCAPGTCWDQNLCTCVRTNNTGYDLCVPFAVMDFDNNDDTARDFLYGYPIYTTVGDEVSITGEVAHFEGGNITVSGLANTWLSNRFVMHFEFTLTEGVNDGMECLVGSCSGGEQNDSFAITINNEEEADDMLVYLTYKDKEYWVPGTDTIERVMLELNGNYESENPYEFWLFYGWDEMVMAGVLNNGGNTIVSSDMQEVDGSVMLVNPASGFVFGECLYGGEFIGDLDNIELGRNCLELPAIEVEIAEAFDLIAASVSGPG